MVSIGSRRRKHYYLTRNKVELLQSGPEFFSRLEHLIRQAKEEIHLQTYIFASDTTGKRIIEALLDAASRNVRIYLLIDAYGSQKLNSAIIRKMRETGIHIRKYGRFYSRGRFHIGRRLHQKVTVFDGYTSIVGGINISDNYNDTKLGKAWLDFAVIIEGEISRKLQILCRHLWSGSLKRKLENACTVAPIPDAFQTRIRVRRNDFIRNYNEVATSYRQGITKARKSILIVGGYFLPGGRTRRLLKNAIRRGVEVRVVTAEKSDVTILRNARRYLYRWLIDNKIRLYSYNPANVHGKIMIVDGKWTTIGSYDLNNLSTYSNIELNVDIDDIDFSKNTTIHLEQIISKDCSEITEEKIKVYKNWWNWIVLGLSYRIVKTLFVLSVILAGKRKEEF